MTGVGRRGLILGAAAALAAPRLGLGATGAESVEAILAASGLGAVTGFAVADLDGGGTLLEGHDPAAGRPPASVAKLVTTLYGRDALGADYRFRTALLAGGPVSGGTLDGDLVLAGGGDPVLDTNGLATLADALSAAGVTGITGRFFVADGALPAVAEVAADQPEDAAYNPTISGMNLDFNRVEIRWAPGEPLAFSAPGTPPLTVPVAGIGGAVGDGPIRHRFEGGREVWSLPAARVDGSGADWLPVRAPAAYAGEVMAGLAGRNGLALPPPQVVAEAAGTPLATVDSPALDPMLRDMLRYSTNLTAEVVGLRASQSRGLDPAGPAASAAAMSAWARDRFGLPELALVDHSGLGDASRVSPASMVSLLRQADGLAPLMRLRPIEGPDRRPVDLGVSVLAKTGTLFFASGLAGYMTGRRRLAFAIFVADFGRRAQIRPEDRAKPPGSAAWTRRARAQEQALLRRWATRYASRRRPPLSRTASDDYVRPDSCRGGKR